MAESQDDRQVPAPFEPDAAAVIVVDVNEPLDMGMLLRERGAVVERRRLARADYVVGPVGIERKTVGDFYRSMVQKRLFEQLARLKEAYPEAALLLEGETSAFERPTLGALLAVSIDMEVKVIPTADKRASADALDLMARRVGRSGTGAGGRSDVRFKPRMLGPHAEQKFVVQGLPGIGDIVSDGLLEHFGSLRRLFAASEKELLRAPGVGKGRARDVTELLDRPYRGRQRSLPPE